MVFTDSSTSLTINNEKCTIFAIYRSLFKRIIKINQGLSLISNFLFHFLFTNDFRYIFDLEVFAIFWKEESLEDIEISNRKFFLEINQNILPTYWFEKTIKRCKIKFPSIIKIFFSIFTLFSIVYNECYLELQPHKNEKPEIYRCYSFKINFDSNCGVSLVCKMENISQGCSYINENIDINGCFFSRSLVYNGDGGVICITDAYLSMNVTFSMFYFCIATNGGAIWFSSINSSLRMICANQCSATTKHFAYLHAPRGNCVEYLSIAFCSQTSEGSHSLWLYKGNQKVYNINSSMNNANCMSCIMIQTPNLFASSHCTFSNNQVSDTSCISFFYNSGTMFFANIVYNNSPNGGVITVNGAGSTKLMYCIFQNNQNTLFYVDSGSLEVSHSFIDHIGSFSQATAVSTSNNNSFTYINTYQLQFFNSLHCHTDFPERTIEHTMSETYLNTKEITLIQTQHLTMNPTVKETLEDTSFPTFSLSLYPTIDYTFPETHIQTLRVTLEGTEELTPIPTNNKTEQNTLSITKIETPSITIDNTVQNTLLPTLLLTSTQKATNSFFSLNEKNKNLIGFGISIAIIIAFSLIIYCSFGHEDDLYATFIDSVSDQGEKKLNTLSLVI